MKKQLLFILWALLGTTLFAQQKLKKQFTVTIPGEGGSNSCSVVWHPVYKKYFTAMVGNAIYPFVSFDVTGKNVKELSETGQDLRGMWYNPISKRLEFNCYDSTGIGYYKQNKDGSIAENIIVKEGMHQPNGQSVGSYMKEGNKILFFSGLGEITCYNATTLEQQTSIVINVSCKTKQEVENRIEDMQIYEDGRNLTQVVYTGIKGTELGIFDIDNKQIELYNIKTGLITKILQLPNDAPINASFNFCYNNGFWWLFNKDTRSWTAYK
jgi:hypothetical protein